MFFLPLATGGEVQLFIDQHSLVFQFSADKNSLEETAAKRDRFNLALALYAGPFILDYLDYTCLPPIESVIPLDNLPKNKSGSFSIYLNFKNRIDERLLDLMFNKQIFPDCEISKFFSPESRDTLLAFAKANLPTNHCSYAPITPAKLNSVDPIKALYLNIQYKQPVLLLPTLADYVKLIELLKRWNHPENDVYDDLLNPNDVSLTHVKSPEVKPKRSRVFFFSDYVPDIGMEFDRYQATKVLEAALEKDKTLRTKMGFN